MSAKGIPKTKKEVMDNVHRLIFTLCDLHVNVDDRMGCDKKPRKRYTNTSKKNLNENHRD